MVKNKLWIVIFILPTILLFIFVFAVSLIVLFGSSFTDWTLMSDKHFVGLQNYIELITKDKDFIKSLINTVIWIVLQSAVHVAIGILFALILARKQFYWKFARTVYMLPNIISSAALGMLYVNILNPEFGIINGIMNILGVKDFSLNWFMDYKTAFFSVTMTWLPYAAVTTILILAELAAIPESIFESARIDGASEYDLNVHIVLPMLKNIIGTCVILAGTSMLHKLDIILMTTGGGPGNETLNLPIYIYKTALMDNNFGYANAIGVYLIMLGIVFVLMTSRLFKIGDSNL